MSKLGAGQLSRCEEMLRGIPDVVSARVVLDGEGSISQIRILAGAERNAASIAADVIAGLKKNFGVDVDPANIIITHLQEPAGEGSEATALSSGERPRFVGLNMSSKGNKIEVRVELASRGKILSGVAVGPASARNRRRLIAQAMLSALESESESGYSFILEDLTVVTLAGKQVALVAVSLLSPLGEEFLTGSAVVDEEEPEAIVKATLDAINRRLSVLM